MVLLQAVPQHRPIDFVQQSVMDLDNVVGPDAQYVLVVRGVVDLAERWPLVPLEFPVDRCPE